MSDAERIAPQEVKKELESAADTLLVCAYESREKFEDNHLGGAIALSDLESRLDSIDRARKIVFYCA